MFYIQLAPDWRFSVLRRPALHPSRIGVSCETQIMAPIRISTALTISSLQYLYEGIASINSSAAEEDKKCYICQDYFNGVPDSDEEASDGLPRCDAIRLPCGHRIGKQCFEKWRAHVNNIQGACCILCKQDTTTLESLYACLLYQISVTKWFAVMEDAFDRDAALGDWPNAHCLIASGFYPNLGCIFIVQVIFNGAMWGAHAWFRTMFHRELLAIWKNQAIWENHAIWNNHAIFWGSLNLLMAVFFALCCVGITCWQTEAVMSHFRERVIEHPNRVNKAICFAIGIAFLCYGLLPVPLVIGALFTLLHVVLFDVVYLSSVWYVRSVTGRGRKA